MSVILKLMGYCVKLKVLLNYSRSFIDVSLVYHLVISTLYLENDVRDIETSDFYTVYISTESVSKLSVICSRQ